MAGRSLILVNGWEITNIRVSGWESTFNTGVCGWESTFDTGVSG